MAETRSCRCAALYRPADLSCLGYCLITGLLTVVASPRLSSWYLFTALHAVAVVVQYGILRLEHRYPNKFWCFVRHWYFLVFVMCAFRELHYLVPAVHPVDRDDWLIKVDYALFGVHPTVWLERLTTDWLTELLQWFYLTYMLMPLTLAATLFCLRRRNDMLLFVNTLLLSIGLSYLGYICVPALGPRYVLRELQTVPLGEVWLAESMRQLLNELELTTRDCFPSGHAMVAWIVLVIAWRLHRPSFWIYLVPVLGLTLSTVYLRYHYVIDVLVGLALVPPVLLVGKRFHDWHEGKRGRPPSV